MPSDNQLISYKIAVDVASAISQFTSFYDRITALNNRVSDLTSKFNPFYNIVKLTSTQFKSGAAGLNDFNKRLDGLSTRLSKLRNSTTGGWGLTFVATGILGTMLNPLINFEKSQALLQGYGGFPNKITGANNAGIPFMNAQGQQLFFNPAQAMRQEAMYIGANTIKTTTEASEGLLSLAKMGWDIGKIARLGMPVTQLAIAGDLDVSDAGRIIGMALNQFGSQANRYSRAAGEGMPTFMMDQIVNAAAMSQMNVKEMLQYLGRGGATAAAAGIDFTQFLAIAATIKDAVGGTSVTATGLRSAVIDMLAPTARSLYAYNLLGISNMHGDLQKKGTLGFVQEVNQRLIALHPDNYTRVNILNDLFGKQQAASGAALLQNIDKIIDRVNLLNTTSAGKMAMINQYLNNSLFGAWKLMLSRIENFIIVLGNTSGQGGGGLTQGLSNIMQGVSVIFQKLANMPQLFKRLAVDAILLTGSLLVLGIASKVFGFAISLVEVGIKSLVGVIAIANFAMKAWGFTVAATEILILGLQGGLEGVIAALSLITGLELAIAAPFIAAGAAIAAVIAGIYTIYKLTSNLAPEDQQRLSHIKNLMGIGGPIDVRTGKPFANTKEVKPSSPLTDLDKAKQAIFKEMFGKTGLGNFNIESPMSVLNKMPKALSVLSYVDTQVFGRDPEHLQDRLTAQQEIINALRANENAINKNTDALQYHKISHTSNKVISVDKASHNSSLDPHSYMGGY